MCFSPVRRAHKGRWSDERPPVPPSSRDEMNAIREHFRKHGYAVLRSLLEKPKVSFFYAHALRTAAGGAAFLEDSQVPGTPSVYGDPWMEMLLEELVSQVEQATTLKVYPTYAYFRVYKRGDVLAKHRDRPSCEISLSVNLGHKAASPWPFWIEGPTGSSRIELNPGDAVLYRGVECFHWREAFAGDHAAQVFLHYVDQSGPYAEWKFDKRERLNALPGSQTL